jgi:hypothetical protein
MRFHRPRFWERALLPKAIAMPKLTLSTRVQRIELIADAHFSISADDPQDIATDIYPTSAARVRNAWRAAGMVRQLKPLSHGRLGREEHVQFTADVVPLIGRERRRRCRDFELARAIRSFGSVCAQAISGGASCSILSSCPPGKVCRASSLKTSVLGRTSRRRLAEQL